MGDLWMGSTVWGCCRTLSLSLMDTQSDALRWVFLILDSHVSGVRLGASWQSSEWMCDVPPGVLPDQDSGQQPGVSAVVLQRVSEGDGFGHLQRSESSPRCSHLQRHQLALSSHLYAAWYGKIHVCNAVFRGYFVFCWDRCDEYASWCVFALRWSTRLAAEAGSSLNATWTSWTALWSPSSTEVALVYHRLPWTWSSRSTSHTPSNAHADHDTLQLEQTEIHWTDVGEHRKRSCRSRRDLR